MAQQEVARLYRGAQSVPGLRDKLSTAKDLAHFVQMAHEFGYQFTIDEWQKATGFTVEELACEVSEIPGI
jgi:uncharacterized protein YmfQ (DUF2313 family)